MRKIRLIGYACGWGAKIYGCKDGPAYFKNNPIEKSPQNGQWQDIYNSPLENKTTDKLLLVEDYCNNLCDNVAEAITNGDFPVTIGGDHTIAIGTWSGVTKALNANCDFGLIWFDAHMDAHTPETSDTGRYHGMPLATLLGEGNPSLCNIGSDSKKLSPEHICLIGIRSFEDEEAKFLQDLGVKIFFMDDVKKLGLNKIMDEAIAIAQKAKSGFGVTVDLDVFDPSIAPGTGCHEDGGLVKDEFIEAISRLSNHKDLQALEVAEYDPNLDNDQVTLRLIHSIINAVTINQ